ncbi:MAG: hypothetical protein ACRD0Z_10760 [Acidimicrobiales bacterium]
MGTGSKGYDGVQGGHSRRARTGRSMLFRVVCVGGLMTLALPVALLVAAAPASAQTDPYSALTYAQTASIAVGSDPMAVAVDATTDTVYVANNGLGPDGDTVTVIDGATNPKTSARP